MKPKNRVRNNRGSALLIALAVLSLLSLAALMAVRQADTDVDLSFNQHHADQAFYIAEAGARRSLSALNEDNSWRTGYTNVDFEDGQYSSRLEDSTHDAALADTIIIYARGNRDGAETLIEVWSVPEYLYPWRYAMFARDGINFDRNTCTDSYSSDSGGYAATVLDSLGSVGTNGSITGSKQVNIGGDAQTATGGSISLGAGSQITGDSSTTMDSVEFDLVSQAKFDWVKANNSAPGGLSGVNYNYNNGTNELTLGSSGSVVMQSGQYYFSSITAEQLSAISLAPGAKVEIYVQGDIIFRQSSTFNLGGSAADALIFSKGSLLQFDQGNIFHGAFYGPDAHIQYDQTTQVYGSLIGGTIQLDKDACFHYDRDLARLKYGTTGRYLEVAWREQAQ